MSTLRATLPAVNRVAIDGAGRFRGETESHCVIFTSCGEDDLAIGPCNTHIACIGTLCLRLPARNLEALAPACESDDFVAVQLQDAIAMTFRPLHDRVLVRRIKAAEKTEGGIIIPDTVKEKPQEGEVVAVGVGAKSEEGKVTPLDVKAGDKILFGKWSGTEVKIDGEDLIIMKESDILGIVG